MRFLMKAVNFDSRTDRGRLVVSVGGTVNGITRRAFLSGADAARTQEDILTSTPPGMYPSEAGHLLVIDGSMRVSAAGHEYIDALSARVLKGAELLLRQNGLKAAELVAAHELPPEVAAFLSSMQPEIFDFSDYVSDVGKVETIAPAVAAREEHESPAEPSPAASENIADSVSETLNVQPSVEESSASDTEHVAVPDAHETEQQEAVPVNEIIIVPADNSITMSEEETADREELLHASDDEEIQSAAADAEHTQADTETAAVSDAAEPEAELSVPVENASEKNQVVSEPTIVPASIPSVVQVQDEFLSADAPAQAASHSAPQKPAFGIRPETWRGGNMPAEEFEIVVPPVPVSSASVLTETMGPAIQMKKTPSFLRKR